MRSKSRLGLDVNVDFYAAVAYSLIGLQADLYASLFAVGRMAGWSAQILEQGKNNILIRPLLKYDGPPARAYVSSGARR